MYQNYSSTFNPLENHFRIKEANMKVNNTTNIIVAFIIGVIVGLVIYDWINNQNEDEYDFVIKNKLRKAA